MDRVVRVVAMVYAMATMLVMLVGVKVLLPALTLKLPESKWRRFASADAVLSPLILMTAAALILSLVQAPAAGKLLDSIIAGLLQKWRWPGR